MSFVEYTVKLVQKNVPMIKTILEDNMNRRRSDKTRRAVTISAKLPVQEAGRTSVTLDGHSSTMSHR
jgi:hypothetical protein